MEMIALSEITTENKYLRTDSDVEKLKKSIQTIGLINPITINKDKKLIAGGRRYKALKELGFKEVAVNIIDDNSLKQELISIDENLVRQDLTKIEIEKNLNRGREIYEELFPSAVKVDQEDLSKPDSQNINEELPDDKRSFLDLTSEKTGLSKKSIKQAIDRDALSSDKIKQLRSQGELNASQTNELIKLKKSYQDQVVDLVKNKPAKDVKKLVKSINAQGLEKAVEEESNSPSLPREYEVLHILSKRMNRSAAKILLEEIVSEHPETKNIIKSLTTLRNHLEGVLELYATDTPPEDASTDKKHQRFFSEESLELHPLN